MSGTDIAIAENRSLAAPDSPSTSLLNFVALAVKDPSIDVTKLEALLRMQREIVADDAKAQFNRAFLRLQSKLPRITKRGEVEYKGQKAFKFARWEDVDAAIRPVLAEEGFSLSFTTQPRQGDGGGLIVTAILRHAAGHSTETSIPVPLDSSGGKNSMQGYGSSLSYGKRYAATAALNIITEGADDDGKRGGTRYITQEQTEELRALMKDAGRQEGPFLDHLFSGAVRSCDEIEVGQFVVVKNMLDGILRSRAKKGAVA
jgi:hypothetical protein